MSVGWFVVGVFWGEEEEEEEVLVVILRKLVSIFSLDFFVIHAFVFFCCFNFAHCDIIPWYTVPSLVFMDSTVSHTCN